MPCRVVSIRHGGPEPRGHLVLKRMFDIVVGTLLVIVVSPVIVVLAIITAVLFRAWPLFSHERVGLRGRPFRLIKLRTMPPSTPPDADKFVVQQLDLPRFARFLRGHHLDELPQLLLVPLGRMSLVGPRPEMTRLHRSGDQDFGRARVNVRPGCAGLWQISIHSGLMIWDAPHYDLFYVEHASLRLDVWILWRAVLKILGIGQPVSVTDIPRWACRTDSVDDHLLLPAAELAADNERALSST
jgi:lipopolysaccharide/colanic/teichoic acid biosynthesis glycosyltransferase